MGPTRKLTTDETAMRAQTSIQEKDETEQRLEKILFGDQAGFLDSLSNNGFHARENALQRIASASDDGFQDINSEDEMEDIADEDLFFLDAGTSGLPAEIVQDLKEASGKHAANDNERMPTWADSDDERIVVSLASNPRLRKLRNTEDDDVVNGTDYIARLRRQYEMLHPTPAWVNEGRKKRKQLNTHDSDLDADSDVSMDDENSAITSVQPLSELLRTAGIFTTQNPISSMDGKPQRRKLRPEILDIQRVKDICGPGPAAIDNLEFHPNYPLILAAGPSSTITLHYISPDSPNPNPVISSLHLKGTPIHTAAFSIPQASKDQANSVSTTSREQFGQTNIILSSRRPYFHAWSLNSGKIAKITRPVFDPVGTTKAHKSQRTTERLQPSPCGQYIALIGSSRHANSGSVNILSLPSYQWLATCAIESGQGVADFAWWVDGDGITVAGKNGEISEYSVHKRRVILRWRDEGGVGVTTLALGGSLGTGGGEIGGDRYVAVGSQSGITSIYDRRDWAAQVSSIENSLGESGVVDAKPGAKSSVFRPEPLRTLDQLTTPTSHLEFSHDGQMLVMSSRWKKNALKLVHLPSCTVYKNWPTDKTPLGRVSAIALSRDSRYLAIANEQGRIRLWQISD